MTFPPPEVEHIVLLQMTRRREDAAVLQRSLRGEMAAKAAARGVLRSGWFTASVQDMMIRTFVESGTGIIADLLGIASDLGNAPAALDWLEATCLQHFADSKSGLISLLQDERRGLPLPSQRAGQAASGAILQLQRDAKIAFGRVRLRIAGALASPTAASLDRRDFFISHAGEDRDEFVALLVAELAKRGRTFWYSEFELTLGDSLIGKIDEGLRMSRYGVVILSPSFFNKPWPRAELDGLAARAVVENRKVILPIWHKLDHAGVAAYSPILAGRLGIQSSKGVAAVADAIEAVVRQEV